MPVSFLVGLGSVIRSLPGLGWQVPARRSHGGGSGRVRRDPFTQTQIGNQCMAPGLQELIALSLLAGLGFGVALARDDLFFAAVFGIASAVTIIETIRRR